MVSKRYTVSILPVLAGLLLTACTPQNHETSPTKGDHTTVVSSSFGDITKDNFYNELKDTAGEEVLRNMIYEKLLRHFYQVDKHEVNKELAKLRKDYNVSTNEELDQYVQTHFQQTLGDIRHDIEISQLSYQAITDGVSVSEKEIKQRYEVVKKEVKARHILVKTQEEANVVEKKLKEGESFSQVARDFSVDTKTANNGGDLGFFNQEGLGNTTLAKTAFHLKPHEISSPILSSDGYHILEVVDTRTISYDKAKEEIKKNLLTPKAKTLEEAIRDLQDKAKLDIKDPDLMHILDISDQPVG